MDFNAFYEGDKSWELDNEGLLEQLEAFQEQLTRMGDAIGHTIYHLEQASEAGDDPNWSWWRDWLRDEAEGALCSFYRLAGEFASDVAASVGVKVQASSSSSLSTISSE